VILGQANSGVVFDTVHKTFVRLCTCCTRNAISAKISSCFFALIQHKFSSHKKAVECVITSHELLVMHIVAQHVMSYMCTVYLPS